MFTLILPVIKTENKELWYP